MKILLDHLAVVPAGDEALTAVVLVAEDELAQDERVPVRQAHEGVLGEVVAPPVRLPLGVSEAQKHITISFSTSFSEKQTLLTKS